MTAVCRIAMMFLFLLGISLSKQALAQKSPDEAHRPQIHFSPKAKWMNDPEWNGLS